MRCLAGIIALALAVAVSTASVAGSTSQEAFRKAKPDDIKSIEAYCEAALATFSFPERNKLMRLAIQLMQVDMRAEANVLLKQINSLEQSDANLATMICKPR
jgi:flagellar basal body-associated protein FliL